MPSDAVRRRHERARALMLAVTACARIVAEAHRERTPNVLLHGEPVADVHGLQLDLVREVMDAADAMMETDLGHFAGPGDELAPRRRLRQAVRDLVAGLAGLPDVWRPAAAPKASDAVASPHLRAVLGRLVRLKLRRLERAAEAGEPPGPELARAAAAGLLESLVRLERAERDLRVSPAAIARSWRRREESIAAFDQTWRRVTSRLRALYREVGLDDLLAAPQAEDATPPTPPGPPGPPTPTARAAPSSSDEASVRRGRRQR